MHGFKLDIKKSLVPIAIVLSNFELHGSVPLSGSSTVDVRTLDGAEAVNATILAEE